MITLYTKNTPNGYKISIMLELLKLDYEVREISFDQQEQKSNWYLAMNPNGKIPLIIDHDNENKIVDDSAVILIYLAERYGPTYLAENKRYEILEWLYMQTSHLGPMQGQAHVFMRYAPEKIQYGIERYSNEVRRIYSIYNERLKSREYLVDTLTIADIAAFPWICFAPWAQIDLDDYPHLKRWRDRLYAIPAFAKGMTVPSTFEFNQSKESIKLGLDIVGK